MKYKNLMDCKTAYLSRILKFGYEETSAFRTINEVKG